MGLEILPWTAAEQERVRAIGNHPSLLTEFEWMLGNGFDRGLADPFLRPETRRLAVLDGRDVGFAFTFVVPTRKERFAAIRIGVIEEARRRGVGGALFHESLTEVERIAPDVRELDLVSHPPNPAADAFASGLGFSPSRKYWWMERPGRIVPDPEWPEGVGVRVFEPGERDIARWVDVFNRSWSEHHHGVVATPEDVRRLIEGGVIDPAGAHFAERDGRALGFVRCALQATRGEIAVLGVAPEERRHGLGRALLRFGCRWLIEHGAARVTLLVDGENERALTLYRRESFEVEKTRQVWTRWLR